MALSGAVHCSSGQTAAPDQTRLGSRKIRTITNLGPPHVDVAARERMFLGCSPSADIIFQAACQTSTANGDGRDNLVRNRTSSSLEPIQPAGRLAPPWKPLREKSGHRA